MPFGIFSTPNTSAQSYWPARIAPAASCSAAPPLAQPASTSTIGTPVSASAPSTLWPDATPPYAVPQNAAWNGGIAGLGERGAHRVHAHVGRRLALEAAERMDARCRLCERPRHHSVGQLVGDERHRLAELELRGIGLARAA